MAFSEELERWYCLVWLEAIQVILKLGIDNSYYGGMVPRDGIQAEKQRFDQHPALEIKKASELFGPSSFPAGALSFLGSKKNYPPGSPGFTASPVIGSGPPRKKGPSLAIRSS
jgi:hypothetical protein